MTFLCASSIALSIRVDRDLPSSIIAPPNEWRYKRAAGEFSSYVLLQHNSM